jgi:sugar phosphate permease
LGAIFGRATADDDYLRWSRFCHAGAYLACFASTKRASQLARSARGCLGFRITSPYSYLAGAMALDFGAKQAAATSSGIIDGVGYLGGVLSLDAVARNSLASG